MSFTRHMRDVTAKYVRGNLHTCHLDAAKCITLYSLQIWSTSVFSPPVWYSCQQGRASSENTTQFTWCSAVHTQFPQHRREVAGLNVANEVPKMHSILSVSLQLSLSLMRVSMFASPSYAKWWNSLRQQTVNQNISNKC